MIGSRSCSVHSYLLYQTSVEFFPWLAVVRLLVNTCTLISILLAPKNPLKCADIIVIIYWLEISCKFGREVEFKEFIPTMFPIFSPLVKLPIDVQLRVVET